MYYQSETYILNVLVKDENGTLTDPNSITATIYDTNGTTSRSTGAMTKDSTGTYHYDYTFAADANIGYWTAKVVIVSGSRNEIRKNMIGVERPEVSDVREYLIGYSTTDITDQTVQTYLEDIVYDMTNASTRYAAISGQTLDSDILCKAIKIGTAAQSLKTLRNKGASEGLTAQRIAVSQSTADEYWAEYIIMRENIRRGMTYGA